jgi:hypothetical protein
VFLEGFVSWTMLNPARSPLGLWLFALVAAEACRRRDEAAVEVTDPAATERTTAARPQVAAATATPQTGGAGD